MSVTVNAPEALPAVGGSFDVTVEMSGNPGFAGIGLTLAYDQNRLECTSIVYGEHIKSLGPVSNPNAEGAQ